MKKQKTNTQLVHDFMEYKSALHQAWLLDALDHWATYLTQNPEILRQQMKEGGSANFINPDDWIRCAQDWLDYYNQERGHSA